MQLGFCFLGFLIHSVHNSGVIQSSIQTSQCSVKGDGNVAEYHGSFRDETVPNALKFINGYSDSTYIKMRDDTARTEAYRRAINAHARGKVVLDIGTGALALLAIMAAEAGASKVFAVEANWDAYVKARDAVQVAGFSDKIQILYGHSTNLTLETKADLVVHEILGEIASIEGVALVRLMKRDSGPRMRK